MMSLWKKYFAIKTLLGMLPKIYPSNKKAINIKICKNISIKSFYYLIKKKSRNIFYFYIKYKNGEYNEITR